MPTTVWLARIPTPSPTDLQHHPLFFRLADPQLENTSIHFNMQRSQFLNITRHLIGIMEAVVGFGEFFKGDRKA